PAVADLAEQVLLRHRDVGEEDLVELRLTGDLTQRSDLDAGALHVDDEICEAFVLLAGRGAPAEQDAPIGDMRVRRPHLLTVHHEPIADELDACAPVAPEREGGGVTPAAKAA